MNRCLAAFVCLVVCLFAMSLVGASADDPVGTRVATFNIWTCDSDDERWQRLCASIGQLDADIIGFQELNAERERRCKDLESMGYHLHLIDGGRVIATTWSIGPASPHGHGVQVTNPDGQSIWVFNVHLIHTPYGPYMLAGIPYAGYGGDYPPDDPCAVQTVVRLQEQTRGRHVDALISDIRAARAHSDLPMILLGDFNEPTHLDWAADAVQCTERPVAVAWPTSMKISDEGLLDTFRVLHPDPCAARGDTWSPVYPASTINHGAHEPQDRIDLIYVSQHFTVEQVQLAGPAEDAVDDDLECVGYPSDHRAVIATVHVKANASDE